MLSIDLGIGLTSIAVAVRQAVNYANTWSFATYAQANNGALPGPWADLSRTGLGTRVDASDLVGYGPHNLLTHSWRLSSWNASNWTTPGPTYIGEGDPIDGFRTGRFSSAAGTTGGTPGYYKSFTALGQTPGVCFFYVRRIAGSDLIRLSVETSPTLTYVSFNAATGAITSPSYTSDSATVTAVGDAWLVRLPFVQSTAGATNLSAYPNVTSNSTFEIAACPTYEGQTFVETDGAARYLPRVTYSGGTARGLLIEGQTTQLDGRSSDFDASPWTALGGVTVSKNAATGPDGALSADHIVEPATTDQHGIAAFGRTVTAGTPYTITQIAGKGSRRYWHLRVNDNNSNANAATVVFDFDSGVISGAATAYGTFSAASATATVRADGFVVMSLTFTPSSAQIGIKTYGNASGSRASDGQPSAQVGSADAVNLVLAVHQREVGSAATSFIPNSTTSTVVRAGDFEGVFLTSTALSAAFPGGVGQPWTTVFQYRKGYSVSSDETLFALSAGSSAGSTNLLALQTNGTQAQAVHSGGSGTLSGTLVHDGSTVNKIALSVDPTTGKVSVSVNGAAAVETTGIAFTGSGTTHLIPGARTTGGSTPVLGMEIYDWRNVNTSYTTGASLQALSA